MPLENITPPVNVGWMEMIFGGIATSVAAFLAKRSLYDKNKISLSGTKKAVEQLESRLIPLLENQQKQLSSMHSVMEMQSKSSERIASTMDNVVIHQHEMALVLAKLDGRSERGK